MDIYVHGIVNMYCQVPASMTQYCFELLLPTSILVTVFLRIILPTSYTQRCIIKCLNKHVAQARNIANI